MVIRPIIRTPVADLGACLGEKRPPIGPADAGTPAGPPCCNIMSEKNLEERTRWVYDERAFPIWNASFDKTDRTEMIREDLWAGRSIAILLAVLVAIGLVLALGTVAFVANWR